MVWHLIVAMEACNQRLSFAVNKTHYWPLKSFIDRWNHLLTAQARPKRWLHASMDTTRCHTIVLTKYALREWKCTTLDREFTHVTTSRWSAVTATVHKVMQSRVARDTIALNRSFSQFAVFFTEMAFVFGQLRIVPSFWCVLRRDLFRN